MSPHHGIIGVTQETCMHSCHRYQRPKEEEDHAKESSIARKRRIEEGAAAVVPAAAGIK